MRAQEFITEAPLVDYETLGDYAKPGPFRDPIEKKLVQHPVTVEKAYRFFANTPFNFRLFPANIPGTTKFRETGEKSPEEIRKIFGPYADRIITGSQDAITIVYIGNAGVDKVMLTTWMMAHRFGHALQASAPYVQASRVQTNHWQRAANEFFHLVNETLDAAYGKASTTARREPLKSDLTPEYNALFNAIGTQRSSRTNQIKRPYEFLYELFAQYLKDGHVTLNPLPTNLGYGRQAWGNPTRYMTIQSEFRDELSRAEFSERLASEMNHLFETALGANVGKIFVM
jgi:hypothetical protein